MPDSKKTIAAPVLVDLPAVYSLGGFVQLRSVILQPDAQAMSNEVRTLPHPDNDTGPSTEPVPA
jgi:hypothetical protein